MEAALSFSTLLMIGLLWNKDKNSEYYRKHRKTKKISLYVASYCLIKTVFYVTGQIQQQSELYTICVVKFLTQLPCCSPEWTALSSVEMPDMGHPKVNLRTRSSFHWSTGDREQTLPSPQAAARQYSRVDLTVLSHHFFLCSLAHSLLSHPLHCDVCASSEPVYLTVWPKPNPPGERKIYILYYVRELNVHLTISKGLQDGRSRRHVF